MERKKWSAQTEITPALLKLREKRKWQIALRRYVLEKNGSGLYAPYFGLDIENIRRWFETQFEVGTSWTDFAVNWQFGHIIPVTYFDWSTDNELKLCWNFINLRVVEIQPGKGKEINSDILLAKQYFEDLYKRTSYPLCQLFLKKIHSIKREEKINTEKEVAFLLQSRAYLDKLENYSAFEFALLNSGKNIDEVQKEMAFYKKFEN